MSKRPQNPNADELLNRISQLEMRVEALAQHLQKVDRQQKDWDEIRGEHLKIVDRVQQTHYMALSNAFERIKNMELKLFPNLATDMVQLKGIIGEGDDKVRNHLDHRKPESE